MTARKIIAIAMFALALPITSQASMVFDPDGTGTLTAVDITNLDWSPDSVLADGGNQAIVNYLNNTIDGGTRDTTFTLYAHASLAAGTNDGETTVTPDSGVNLNYPTGSGQNAALVMAEYTAVIGFTETISSVTVSGSNTATAAFDFVNDGNSFFAMFYDTAMNADELAGTGYTDGTRIFEGGVLSTDGGNFTVDPTGVTELFDQAGGDGDQWSGQQTVVGGGNQQTISLEVDTSAGAFINTDFILSELLSAMIINIDLSVPFEGDNNPSMAFSSSPTANGDISPLLGLVNGGITFNAVTGFWELGDGGPDFEFSTDNNSVWDSTAVPEPGILALMGAAFGMLGLLRRRKYT